MTNLNFEGADGLHDKQVKFISDVLVEQGYENSKVLIEPVGNLGDNYVASVIRITVESAGEPLKIIGKVAPQSEKQRQMVNAVLMFNNEDLMYSKVLPKFLSMQKIAGVPEKELFKFPKFYGSYMEAPYEIILLEDLQVSNFAMENRLKRLSNENVKLVLTQLAVFHSLSFALKYKEPDTFAAFTNQLLDVWHLMNKDMGVTTAFDMMEDSILTLLSEEYKAKIKGTISKICTQSAREHQTDLISRHSVIQQGDAWMNNILFKSEAEKLVDCIIIDYQLSKCNSPVADFMYFIFTCTDYGTRTQHYNEWIDHYFSKLDDSLSNFNLRANFVYPRDKFDADLRKLGKISVAQIIILLFVTLREQDETLDMKALETEDMKSLVNSQSLQAVKQTTMIRFKEQAEGVLRSYVEYGYL